MPKSLKLVNAPIVGSYVIFCDALLLVFSVEPTDFWVQLKEKFSALNTKDGLLLLIVPLLSLIATGILSSDIKAALVFWRSKEILPGHRAFSQHAKKDPRISIDSLKPLVGEWPRKASRQNELWYKIYKQVEDEHTVSSAHRNYLLCRELTCVTVVFLVVGAITLVFLKASLLSILIYGVSLFLAFLFLSTTGRNHANRFVRNALVEFQNKEGM